MTAFEAAVIEELRGCREQLTRIADGVNAALEMTAEMPMPVSTEPALCPHPEEQRFDFGMTNGRPDWQCRLCGYRTIEGVTA